MSFLTTINNLLGWIGSSPRLYCDRYARTILEKEPSKTVQGVVCCGADWGWEVVSQAQNHIFQKNHYLWNSVRRSGILVIAGKEGPCRNDSMGVIYINSENQFTVCQIAGLLLFSMIKIRCRKMKIPYTWVSRGKIDTIGHKRWSRVCSECYRVIVNDRGARQNML